VTLSATADVATDNPARYAKQLVSHLGRRLTTETQDGARHVISFDGGQCVLLERDGVLQLQATAQDADALAQVQDVIGRHLERFGERAGLTVSWTAG
jgi:hypothetical protein